LLLRWHLLQPDYWPFHLAKNDDAKRQDIPIRAGADAGTSTSIKIVLDQKVTSPATRSAIASD
jgi:hypothetical protein